MSKNFSVFLIILSLHIKLPWQYIFLTRFGYNKEYVFYSDDDFWMILAEISVFNANSCCICLL